MIKSHEILDSTDNQYNNISAKNKYVILKEDLLNRIVYQLETMLQISKALNSAYRQKNSSSEVVIEAEKILLVASKLLLYQGIQHFSYVPIYSFEERNSRKLHAANKC